MNFFGLVLKILKTLFLLFLVGTLSLDVLAYLFLGTVLDVFLEPKTWTGALERQNFSSILQDIFIEKISAQLGSDSEKPSVFQQLGISSQEVLRETLKKVLPNQLIEQKTNKIISDLLLYLQGKSHYFYGEIDLTDIKLKLADAIMNISWPAIDKMVDEELNRSLGTTGMPCTTINDCLEYCKFYSNANCTEFQEQLEEGLGFDITETGAITDIKSQMKAAVKQKINEEINGYPNSIKLIKAGGPEEEGLNAARNFVGTAYTINTILAIAPFLTVIITGIVTFSIKSTLRWVGIPLLILGLAVMIMGFFAPSAIENAVIQSLENNVKIKDLSKNDPAAVVANKITTLIKGIIFDVTTSFFSLLRLKAAIIALIGLLMIIASFAIGFLTKKKKANITNTNLEKQGNQPHS